MKRTRILLCAAATLSVIVFAGIITSMAAAPLEFEAASIKPAPSLADQLKGVGIGPITLEGPEIKIVGTRADFTYMSVGALIRYAYGMKQYQIVGPVEIETKAFHIRARLPEGGTKEQVPEMMQSLLKERFKLVFHREPREQPAYALIVSKEGHRLKEVALDQTEAAPGDGTKNDKPQGSGLKLTYQRYTVSFDYAHATMAQLTAALNRQVDRPVLDLTELKGTYKFSFEISKQELSETTRRDALKYGVHIPVYPDGAGLGAQEPSGATIYQAIQKLGLKLDPRKMPIETLIIDRIEKAPRED